MHLASPALCVSSGCTLACIDATSSFSESPFNRLCSGGVIAFWGNGVFLHAVCLVAGVRAGPRFMRFCLAFRLPCECHRLVSV